MGESASVNPPSTHLAPILAVAVLALSAERAAHLVTAADRDCYRELACLALALIAERDQTVRQREDAARHLRAQLRAFVSGRTIQDERRDLDAERQAAA